ncbi:L-lactate MFS transporter [Marimonas arenosa]|uniref:OFA family MFS transporter n=2 Tax=Pseudomonadota TaxID=1224 RepID=A0AAE3WD92_9RHOB|nr:OFA family MFS transporter [Marimonas arenosa]MDQ2091126.1 OFA family MFS transporter [Marimonas arenosa]
MTKGSETQRQVLNRWWVVLGAVLIQLSLGAIYAWSVFTPALTEVGWSKLQTQAVFAIGLAMFAVVMVFAGRLLARLGPRRLALMGGATLGAGYVLAGLLGTHSFWVVAICVGLIGGAGIGLAYMVPIAVGMRWFPDRKGMITGLAVAGFGFGAMGWVKLAGSWGGLIERIGLDGTFVTYGVVFAALIVIGSLWMRMPPKGWVPEGYVVSAAATGRKGRENFTTVEMLRTPQFYLIFMTFAVSAGSGLMSIGLMKLYPMEALQMQGLTLAEASAVAGTAMAVFFSLANGVGRVAWGTISDALGRRRSLMIMAASQAVFLFAFTSMAGTPWLLYLGAALIGFNFGGNFALFPAITADTFGNDRIGQNYPLVFLSYGAGGIAFPVLGGTLGDLGNFPLAFSVCAGACVLGVLCVALIRVPDQEEAHRPPSVHGFLHQMHWD